MFSDHELLENLYMEFDYFTTPPIDQMSIHLLFNADFIQISTLTVASE